jgi:CRISPR type IV-associated protein Csf3
MTSFSVQVTLRTPVVLHPDSYLTLDSVLAAMIYQRTENIGRAHADIPLDRLPSGTWHGSAAFLESAIRQRPAEFKNSIELREQARENFITPEKKLKGRVTPCIDLGRSRWDTAARKSGRPNKTHYKATMDTYIAFDAEALYWYGRGDIEAVRDLLSDLHHIGKKRRQGYGQIASIDVIAEDIDASLHFEHRGQVHSMRPIPVDAWTQDLDLPIRSMPIAMAAAVPPYFTAPLIPCVVPSSRERPWIR